MKEILKVRNLSKKFNGHLIVNSLNMTVYEGDVFGFLGPNGAGKTTTIRMILSLIKCNSGEVYINGVSIKDNYKEAISEVAAIVENPKFYDNLTCYDNLKIIKNFHKGVAEERILEVLSMVGLKDSVKRKFKELSLGMKQRLGIAAALLHKPKLIILDEPTNGLDPQGIIEVRELISYLAENERITFFISSHLLHEIELMCNRVAIISKGRVVIQGAVEELLTFNKNIYEFKIDDKEMAKVIIENVNGAKFNGFSERGIAIELNNKEPWEINKALIEKDIKVNGINRINKSLEEYFVETIEGVK
ncbi:ABC transporter ATP-binding protein [Clostridium hydrogeniformans]|uniref:ABC transporter ATP-binding protein n=1 Tax=Clostridium hydrogeniformans TaxID=349933 RepID=UPI0004820E05|nr:ABC transporter ATP-binding protein [Clostridium hydrogeniformans]